MLLQFRTSLRNARAAAIEADIGASPVLRIRTGAAPADCAAARSGTVLASMTLPANWLSDPVGGVVALLGVWKDLVADATGTAGHFEIMDASLTNCGMQGDVSDNAGNGVLKLGTVNVFAGYAVEITGFTFTESNA